MEAREHVAPLMNAREPVALLIGAQERVVLIRARRHQGRVVLVGVWGHVVPKKGIGDQGLVVRTQIRGRVALFL